MIEIIEGRIGGFKSYTATRRAVECLCDGGTVCGNLSLKPQAVQAYCAKKFGLEIDSRQFIALTDEQIRNFWIHVPKRSLVIIDEAHLYLPSLDSAQLFRDLITFATQSRKYSIDIIFITQAAENIHAQVRRLVQYIHRCRDMQRWRVPFVGIYWPFPQYLHMRYDYDGKTMLDKKLYWKDKAIFELYDTLAIYKTSFKTLDWEHAKPKKIQKQSSKRETLLWRINGAIAVCILVLWVAGRWIP